ncbi:DUF2017 domain-containing protein [Streptomyces sp. NPDC050560]|uniref:DUF2017 domain-containing protein n=1 Tax=Streptomyces sp. NPDC050560 TaxID=3365630 RepID=UPI00379F42EF
MSGQFTPIPGGGAAVTLDEVEISIIRSLATQLLELFGPGEETPDDPLAQLFEEGPSEPPSDPVLKRLFPDAYGGPQAPGRRPPDDKEAAEQRERAAEFRRYTENDLRARKRDDALAVIRSLDALVPTGGSAELHLDPEGSRRWLGALNDLRLALGERLEVKDEDEIEDLFRLPDEDPRKPLVMAYLWLGSLQETLVATLLP